MLAVGAIKTPAAEVRCLNSPFEECVVVGISSLRYWLFFLRDLILFKILIGLCSPRCRYFRESQRSSRWISWFRLSLEIDLTEEGRLFPIVALSHLRHIRHQMFNIGANTYLSKIEQDLVGSKSRGVGESWLFPPNS